MPKFKVGDYVKAEGGDIYYEIIDVSSLQYELRPHDIERKRIFNWTVMASHGMAHKYYRAGTPTKTPKH